MITDHSALHWLRNLRDRTGRLARWAIEMQQYDFEIIHRKGALNHFPDALSRIYEDQTVEVEAFEEVADPWYTKMLEVVQKFSIKYRGCRGIRWSTLIAR